MAAGEAQGQLVVGWKIRVPDIANALGIATEPSIDIAVQTLGFLHVRDETLHPQLLSGMVRACYSLLARAVERSVTTKDVTILSSLRRAFSMGVHDGLVFAPPQGGRPGRRWWTPGRVVQGTYNPVTGSYLGYLGNRYPQTGALWSYLGIEREVTPSLLADVIVDLERSTDSVADAREQYGELVAALNRYGEARLGMRTTTLSALTNNGWVPATTARWTSRPEIEAAFGAHINWWCPGGHDPATLQAAATWLGIGAVSSAEQGGSLDEEWDGLDSEPLDMDMEARWQAAVARWPAALRANLGDSPSWERNDVWGKLVTLTPRVAPLMVGRMVLTVDDRQVTGMVAPDVLIRREDGVVLGRDTEALFSRAVAEALAAELPTARLQAATILYGLLADAYHNLAAFARQADRYTPYRPDGDTIPSAPSDMAPAMKKDMSL